MSEAATVEAIDWNSNDEVAVTIVETVATVQETEPTELEPLSSTIDPDALDTLFAASGVDTSDAGFVEFEYEDCRVCVTAEGSVSITPVER